MVFFGDGGVGDGRAGNKQSIIPKHVALVSDVNSKVSQGCTDVNDLVNCCPCSNKFRPIGCSFNCRLPFSLCINWCLV